MTKKILKEDEVSDKEKKYIYIDSRYKVVLYNLFEFYNMPYPANYTTTLENATYFATPLSCISIDIGNKICLLHLKSLYFLPKTIFPKDKMILDDDKIYYKKNTLIECGEGIQILLGKNIQSHLKYNEIIQEEIIPKIYDNKKFEFRVLCCIDLGGRILLYKNLLYKFNDNIYENNIPYRLSLKNQLTGGAWNKRHNGQSTSFFENDKKGIMDSENYIEQLKKILPLMYTRLSKFSTPPSQPLSQYGKFIKFINNYLELIKINENYYIRTIGSKRMTLVDDINKDINDYINLHNNNDDMIDEIYNYINYEHKKYINKNKFFIINGLDFIPDNNNNLKLLEINSTPGWHRNINIKNYQKFHEYSAKFMLNNEIKDSDFEIIDF
jgi:hypothetical protein